MMFGQKAAMATGGVKGGMPRLMICRSDLSWKLRRGGKE